MCLHVYSIDLIGQGCGLIVEKLHKYYQLFSSGGCYVEGGMKKSPFLTNVTFDLENNTI